MNKIILELVRGGVRPVVTVALAFAVIYFVAYSIAVPEWFQTVVIMVLSFWFADRGQRKNGAS